MAAVGEQDGLGAAEVGLDRLGDRGNRPTGVLLGVGVVAGKEDSATVVHTAVAAVVEDERRADGSGGQQLGEAAADRGGSGLAVLEVAYLPLRDTALLQEPDQLIVASILLGEGAVDVVMLPLQQPDNKGPGSRRLPYARHVVLLHRGVSFT